MPSRGEPATFGQHLRERLAGAILITELNERPAVLVILNLIGVPFGVERKRALERGHLFLPLAERGVTGGEVDKDLRGVGV